MLILLENDCVDVIREQGYRDKLTLRSLSAEALKRFDALSGAKELPVEWKETLHGLPDFTADDLDALTEAILNLKETE